MPKPANRYFVPARAAAIATLAMLVASCAGAPHNPVRVTDYGTYKPARGWPIPVAEVKEVPAAIGTRFGFRFRAPFVTLASYRLELDHPAMLIPGSDGPVTRRVRPFTMLNRRHYYTFTFEDPWELVTGTWTFRLYAGSQLLAEQAFEVVEAP